MSFLSQEMDEYIGDHSSAEPEIIYQLQRETWLKHLYPNMLSGHIQGRFLSFISKMLRPKRILEIGTYTAYSTLCLAEGLAEGGSIDTIDVNEELVDIQQRYVEKAGLSDQINLHLGDALNIIPKLDVNYDLVFIDADKENYLNYYKIVLPKLAPSGVILADNVLWEGKTVSGWDDLESNALRAFNQFVQEDNRVENLMLSLRDGLMMVRKVEEK